MSDRQRMEAAVEAVLFVSGEPVSRNKLAEIFDEEEREAAAAAIEAVLERYAPAEERGVQVEEVAGGVRLVTRPDMNEWLRRFFEVSGGSKLSMAALETLAIVAYRQPVTAPEIQELRGVNPSGVLKTLLDRHLVRIAGRKEVVGRPFLYCTTREFLVHFGLKSLKDLPPLEEFEEAFEEGAEGEAEAESGLDAGPGRDREETILRRAADLEEKEAEATGGADDAGGAAEGDDTEEPVPTGPRRLESVPAPADDDETETEAADDEEGGDGAAPEPMPAASPEDGGGAEEEPS